MDESRHDDTPMTQAEMAAQLHRHATTSTSSVAARSYRYERGMSSSGSAPETEYGAVEVRMPGTADTILAWVCSRCGAWLSDEQVGRVHQGHLGQQVQMVECPDCRGVAYNMQQLQAIREEDERAAACVQAQQRRAIVCTTGAALLFMVLPGMAEYLLLAVVAMWVGPLRTLDIKTKMGMLIITGAVFCINVFTAGLLGMGVVTGQWFAYVTATGITAMSLGMALVVDRVGRLGGGLFYR